jgi:nucleoside-diphosphate-sugar epimerase
LATHYLQLGAHVVFLSSTAVFGVPGDLPDEYTAPSPNTTNGALKCATELALEAAARRAAGACTIVRITKALALHIPLLREWRAASCAEGTIKAFNDRRLCPVSLRYVVDNLVLVARRRVAGCFDLAGAQTLSYAVAHALVEVGF